MNIHLKRILCLILVVCLMITLPGCGSSVANLGEGLWRIARTGIYLLSYIVIIPAMWVVDKVTWPFVQYTGFNVNDLGNRVCQAWTTLILPENLMDNGWWGGWFSIRDEEALEAKLRAGGHLDGWDSLSEKMMADYFGPGENPFAQETTPSTEETIPTTEETVSKETLTEETLMEETEKLLADPTLPTETFSAESGEVSTEPMILYTADKALTDVYNLPESQPITGKKDVITEEMPVRPGYHFMGWARVYAEEDVLDGQKQEPAEDETEQQKAEREKAEQNRLELFQNSINKPRYFPGETVDPKNPFTQTTTLYAVWQKDTTEASLVGYPLKHEFTIEQVKDGRNVTPDVTITCSCGMTVTDRNLSELDFWYYCKNSAAEISAAERDRLYKLYLAQDIGPMALQFNTECFDENILFKQIDIGIAEINTKKINPEPNFTNFVRNCQDVYSSMKKVVPAVDKYFKKLSRQRTEKTMAENFFGEISVKKAYKTGSNAIRLVRLLSASRDMLDSDRDILDQTLSMLEVVECAAGFTKSGKLLKPVVQTLTEGLNLIKKCEKTRTAYYNALQASADEIHKLDGTILSPYVFSVTGRDDMAQAYQELTMTGTPGCTCGTSDTCNFDVPGMTLHHYPDTAATVYHMDNGSGKPTALENEFLALYLAERSRHDLYRLTGLTLQQYTDLLKK